MSHNKHYPVLCRRQSPHLETAMKDIRFYATAKDVKSDQLKASLRTTTSGIKDMPPTHWPCYSDCLQLQKNFVITTQHSKVSCQKFHMNYSPHVSRIQLSTTPLVSNTSFMCTIWWLFKFPFMLKRFPHTLHWKGFSPVWILTCCSSFHLEGNAFGQNLQANPCLLAASENNNSTQWHQWNHTAVFFSRGINKGYHFQL